MLQCYVEKSFRDKSLELIATCNAIIADYQAQGFDLTLRQLYYQLVSRALIANNEKSYDNVGALISDARLAGLIDWDAIVDRTRHVRSLPHWDDPSEIIASSAAQFNYDRWADQPRRVEVWIEKDALVGVIEGVCRQYDVPFFSCRGYTSQSEMWGAAQRIGRYFSGSEHAQETTILHFGDHDPSGIDMSRDIEDRLTIFCEGDETPVPEVARIALNMPQIKRYNPPPNPAKLSDCRAAKYIALHGRESWELDALDPKVIAELIRRNIDNLLDKEKFASATERQNKARAELKRISDEYAAVVKHLSKNGNGKKK